MRRLGNHAIIDEEATAKVRQTLGTQYMVVINSNGSRALLKEGAGQYKVDENVGSDPTFYEEEAEGEGGDDDNPPKKPKKRGRPPKNKRGGGGEPGDNGGQQYEDEAEQILQSAQRIKTYRMYRTALARENYQSLPEFEEDEKGDIEEAIARTGLNSSGMKSSVLQKIFLTVRNYTMTNYKERLNYNLTPKKLQRILGWQGDMTDWLKPVIHTLKEPLHFAEGIEKLENLGASASDLDRVIAFIMSLIE